MNQEITNKAKRVIDALLGENEVDGRTALRAATQKLAGILREYSTADIEDQSPHPDDGGYSSGSEEYDTSGEGDDLAFFRSDIFNWIDETKAALSGLSPEIQARARQALNDINVAVRHHMRHETKDCLYNVREPWTQFLQTMTSRK